MRSTRATSASARPRAPRSRCQASRRARWSKSRRSRTSSGLAQNCGVQREIEDYVRGLVLDAYLVGGAVRDELLGLDSKDADFLVPGVALETLRGRLAEHGRVEDLIVADRLVGLRLH